MKPKIYLSGHLQNDWRSKVTEALTGFDVDFLMPLRARGEYTAKFYASRDRMMLNQADIVFAYIQDTPDNREARYVGLSVELGYAAALGKVVVLVNELKGKIDSFDFAEPFCQAVATSFEEGIKILKFCVSKDLEEFKKKG